MRITKTLIRLCGNDRLICVSWGQRRHWSDCAESQTDLSFMRTPKTLIRLRGITGWFEFHAENEDTDQTAQNHRLILVSWGQRRHWSDCAESQADFSFIGATKTLIRLRGITGWFEFHGGNEDTDQTARNHRLIWVSWGHWRHWSDCAESQADLSFMGATLIRLRGITYCDWFEGSKMMWTNSVK